MHPYLVRSTLKYINNSKQRNGKWPHGGYMQLCERFERILKNGIMTVHNKLALTYGVKLSRHRGHFNGPMWRHRFCLSLIQ